jgi:hypothetical protein
LPQIELVYNPLFDYLSLYQHNLKKQPIWTRIFFSLPVWDSSQLVKHGPRMSLWFNWIWGFNQIWNLNYTRELATCSICPSWLLSHWVCLQNSFGQVSPTKSSLFRYLFILDAQDGLTKVGRNTEWHFFSLF